MHTLKFRNQVDAQWLIERIDIYTTLIQDKFCSKGTNTDTTMTTKQRH